MARNRKSKENSKKSLSFSPLFNEYFSHLSSTEKEACLKDARVALPGFRKFVNGLSDERLMTLFYK